MKRDELHEETAGQQYRSVKKGISIKKSNKPLGKSAGSDASDAASILNNRALQHIAQGRYAQAESLYKRALAIREKAFGSDHPDVAASLENMAALYRETGREAEANPLAQRAAAIRAAAAPDSKPRPSH
jgi:tetratricopeptide (TPR) repeat protein